MIIIGEKLNSSIPAAQKAFETGDAAYIRETALRQTECGADYLDLNAGVFPDEAEKLLWAIGEIRAVCATPLVLDSTDPKALEAVLEQQSFERLVINSITLEPARFDGMLPLVQKTGAGVIALPMDETGIPKDAGTRVKNAEKLIERLTANGVARERIYIDLIVETLSVESGAAREALEAARKLRAAYPGVHLVGGLSNVSYGLPKRKYINAAFLTAALAAGLDTGILDITNPETKMALAAAELVLGNDAYCMNYLTEYREVFAD